MSTWECTKRYSIGKTRAHSFSHCLCCLQLVCPKAKKDEQGTWSSGRSRFSRRPDILWRAVNASVEWFGCTARFAITACPSCASGCRDPRRTPLSSRYTDDVAKAASIGKWRWSFRKGSTKRSRPGHDSRSQARWVATAAVLIHCTRRLCRSTICLPVVSLQATASIIFALIARVSDAPSHPSCSQATTHRR